MGSGSPPRMRETLLTADTINNLPGITPAYAGNTVSSFEIKGFFQDHPRVCGKHAGKCGLFFGFLGSPPRMRETLDMKNVKGYARGITPAYAGNTERRRRMVRIREDHPRVCGKHLKTPFLSSNITGSPPRMRETPLLRRSFNCSNRITPAYAGNTSACMFFCRQLQDHPRVCGKHSNQVLRMFGLLRITPAYAGNTQNFFQIPR